MESVRGKHGILRKVNSLIFISLLVGGWFYPPLGYFMIVCMFAAMGIGLIKGRLWCDWMCPRGSFWDSILKPFSTRREVPSVFRHPIFRFGWIVLLMGVLGFQLSAVWGDFYEMGKPFVRILTVTTAVGLLLGLIYQERIWCMFCPMGTMANVLGKNKYPLLITSSCIDCGKCSRVCRMQIKPGTYRYTGTVSDGDCLKCSYCIEVCPKKALYFKEDVTRKESTSLDV